MKSREQRRTHAAAIIAGLAIVLPSTAREAIAAPSDQPSAPKAGDDSRDPTSAMWIAAGTTLAGVAMLGGGIALRSANNTAGDISSLFGGVLVVFGPSAGRDYADDPGPWWPLRLRLAGAGLAVVAAFTLQAECADLDPCPGHPKANVVLGVAAVTVAAGALWDLATTGDAARRYNRRHQKSASDVTLVPRISSDGGGIAVAGAF